MVCRHFDTNPLPRIDNTSISSEVMWSWSFSTEWYFHHFREVLAAIRKLHDRSSGGSLSDMAKWPAVP